MARPTQTGSMNLAKFEHAIKDMSKKDGTKTKCIIIPIAENHLLHTDKGNVFFDFAAFQKDPAKCLNKETHTIKQSLSVAELEKQKIEAKDLPFLGDMKDWTLGFQGSDTPNVSDDLSTPVPDEDDLPF